MCLERERAQFQRTTTPAQLKLESELGMDISIAVKKTNRRAEEFLYECWKCGTGYLFRRCMVDGWVNRERAKELGLGGCKRTLATNVSKFTEKLMLSEESRN